MYDNLMKIKDLFEKMFSINRKILFIEGNTLL